ncbi:unnamed protein product [Nyctereutes procyonoides]|uniref:(raccoon dog) hypothetical protein n=1 Tax=Nyctereutes procyonoides TaxID=34880 RepID=A0A811YKI7_NYCPR|nr:unnamed protein product [Nyctereutes procyonoides]
MKDGLIQHITTVYPGKHFIFKLTNIPFLKKNSFLEFHFDSPTFFCMIRQDISNLFLNSTMVRGSGMGGSGMGGYGRDGMGNQGGYGSVGRMGMGNNYTGGYGTPVGLGVYGHGGGGSGGYYGQGGMRRGRWHGIYKSITTNIKVLTAASGQPDFLRYLISFVF